MKYTIFKLNFTAGVHFGNGMLNDSEFIFRSDSLFSALYIEALKQGVQESFYSYVKENKLIWSDAMPYSEAGYMLPKPIMYIEKKDRGDSEVKKKIKKLKYIFSDDLKAFLAGEIDIEKYRDVSPGYSKRHTKAAVEGLEETRPYHVGVYYFKEGYGLYIIVGYENDEAYDLVTGLFESLSYTGIGGEKSGGLGRFSFNMAKRDDELLSSLGGEHEKYMLLSTALPSQKELREVMESSTYLLLKRSGFVYSDTFSETGMRKEDMFMFAAGSCFNRYFDGDIFEVGRGGDHPVYRCGKALLLGI